MRYIAKFIMWIAGWKYVGEIPKENKSVVAAVPHTSGWDFFWGEMAFLSIGLPTYILMKKEYFFFPLGVLLRALKVIPVDRGKKDSQLVDQLIDEFGRRKRIHLCITPEGSRKKRKKWKKGFLVIANAVNVPVHLGRLDYKRKEVTVGPIFQPTGDIEADMKYIMSTYRDANPKYPENFYSGED
ncbi:MAG: 1-acyl-sn-glycerol-3-phosphate acyltransferase [Culturomica sp.]|jgi:1-acyl-sn-glycerol-3-phosphate acyltransferase|nr:1-acyl-sn-glycerol-3-phosphate acyltransferase [Culturomica sp.]